MEKLEKEIVKELCSRSLSLFIREAWHILEPSQPYTHGKHIDLMCEHLEAVTRGEITRLLINIPPGCMKSLLTGVFWPMWEWGPMGRPETRILSVAHEQSLAVRDNLKARRLFTSDWFQSMWPCGVQADQNQKLNFQNERTGYRQASTRASITGRRGDRLIIDDPLSVSDARSDLERQSCAAFFTETAPTRLTNPDSSAIVMIMQRLHEEDPSALAIELGYEHLCLPMRYEKAIHCKTSIGEDWREKEGDLLFPDRFDAKTVDELEKVMGPYATAGQHQQTPVPRGGGMFREEWFPVHAGPQWPITRQIRSWDMAATEGGGDWTVGVLIGVEQAGPNDPKDGNYWVLDVIRGQWASHQRDSIIQATAEMDGKKTAVHFEQEPGSAGKSLMDSMKRMLTGWRVTCCKPTGAKEVRAEAMATQAGIGRFRLKEGVWNQDFIDEAKVFYFGKHDDQIDACASGFNELVLKRANFTIA